MEVFTQVIGFKIEQKGSVNLNLRMGVITKGLGKIINYTVQVNTNGQTDLNTQANILMIYKMVKEHSIGKMERSMKDNGKKENSMAKAS